MTSWVRRMASCTEASSPWSSMMQGWPSGTRCSIWMRAPERRWSSLMVSPPLPMTRPTRFFGHSNVARFPARPIAAGEFPMSAVTSSTPDCTLWASPSIVTSRGWPSGKFWSIWIRAPLRRCRSFMVSPCFPMSRPTRDCGQGTVSRRCRLSCASGVVGSAEKSGDADDSWPASVHSLRDASSCDPPPHRDRRAARTDDEWASRDSPSCLRAAPSPFTSCAASSPSPGLLSSSAMPRRSLTHTHTDRRPGTAARPPTPRAGPWRGRAADEMLRARERERDGGGASPRRQSWRSSR
mmetsp:Transcript_2045/g.6185  ORF Transcript_2045/g.6185 Transcript_2045/m.6185 type:complete len:295 (-) Transcript_2045:1465-2349(-)